MIRSDEQASVMQGVSPHNDQRQKIKAPFKGLFLLRGLVLMDTFKLPLDMDFQVIELQFDELESPYSKWFNKLPPDVAAKVATANYRMQQGNLSNIEWFSGIGEYKINYGSGWRIYLAKDGADIIILLGGGTKNGQQRDIDHAIKLWKEYKRKKTSLLKNEKLSSITTKRKR